MTDELDRDLRQAFARAAETLPDSGFRERLTQRVAWHRRLGGILRWGAAGLILLVAVAASRPIVAVSLIVAERLGGFLTSTPGWALSLLLAATVFRRLRLFRKVLW